MQPKKIQRALISVYDKTRLDELAKVLIANNIEIYCSGGTKKYLEDQKITCHDTSKLTKNPEAFGGRMKTLSFEIASGILFNRSKEEDWKQVEELGLLPLDLVVCNFYPFEKKDDVQEMIELIDIGGPTMVRAAAKNHQDVTVLISPHQYEGFCEELTREESISCEAREQFAIEAFETTLMYEQKIYWELASSLGSKQTLRYGENPHQKAFLIKRPGVSSQFLANAPQIQGKQLSYNNYLDADAALKCMRDMTLLIKSQGEQMPYYATMVFKHGNPCGVCVGKTPLTSLEKAWQGDPKSAFGSILAFNHEVSREQAQWLKDYFVEVILAPGFSQGALELFQSKKNLRLLLTDKNTSEKECKNVRSIDGGFLFQSEDEGIDREIQVMGEKILPPELVPVGLFGTLMAKYTKSNALALVTRDDEDELTLVTSGGGQPNRVEALELLIAARLKEKKWNPEKSVLVSDAFFPFDDIVSLASSIGIKHMLQPGGSLNDQKVIAKANEKQVSMAFTGMRHFRH